MTTTTEDRIRKVNLNLYPGQVLVILSEEDCDFLIDAADAVLEPEKQDPWDEDEKSKLRGIRKSLVHKAKKARQDARKSATLPKGGE